MKTVKKILAFDIDGTVLPYGEKEIPHEILASLKALRDMGVALAVSTGRSYASVRQLFPDGGELLCICHDGAVSYEKGRAFYRRPIPAEALHAFWQSPANDGRTLVFYTEDAAYIRRGSGDDLARADVAEPFLPVTTLHAMKAPVYKMAAYGGRIGFGGCASVRRTHRSELAEEYVCAYTSKGAALTDLQARLGLSYFDTWATGDGLADIPLFRHAAVSCAPPDALEAVKEAADRAEPVDSFLRSLVNIVQPKP